MRQSKRAKDLKRERMVVLGIVLAATMGTISCSCPLVSFIAAAPTVTPTPTKTPKPSVTPVPRETPTPVETSTPTATNAPTEPPIPAVTDTPTFTPVPPIPTRRPPTATSTPRYRYSVYSSIEYLPDCEMTTLEGTVWDIEPPRQLADIWLKVCVEGEYWCATLVTPTNPDKGGDGYYQAILGAEGPRAGSWWVAVVDFSGNPISERVSFQTDTHNCEFDGNGRQWVIIDFQRNY
jgi:hypothetical protein